MVQVCYNCGFRETKCICLVCDCVRARVCTLNVYLPAIVTEVEEVGVVSGLQVSVREGFMDGVWVEEAAAAEVLAVVLTLLELAAAVAPTLTPVPVPATSRGLSSDCWMIFTPSGLLHDDSLVLAL